MTPDMCAPVLAQGAALDTMDIADCAATVYRYWQHQAAMTPLTEELTAEQMTLQAEQEAKITARLGRWHAELDGTLDQWEQARNWATIQTVFVKG